MAQLTTYANGAVEAAALACRHGDVLVSLACGLDAEGPNRAVVTGSRGVITAHAPFFCPPFLSLRPTFPGGDRARGGAAVAACAETAVRQAFGSVRHVASRLKTRRIPTLFEGTGLHYQADHFADCLRGGLTVSPVMPLADSIATLRILQAARGGGD